MKTSSFLHCIKCIKMIKNTILTLSIFLISFSALKAQRNWGLGVHYTPNIAKPIFDNKETGNGEPLLNHKFGLDVYYRLGDKLELKSGVAYRNVQFRQELDVDILALHCSDGFVTTNIIEEPYPVRYDDKYSVHYIGIPLEGRFFIGAEKKNLYAKVGIEALMQIKNKLLQSEIDADHDCKKPHRLDLNDVRYAGSVGVGYELAWSSKIKLLIEPSLGFTFNKMFKKPDTSVYNITNNVRNNIQMLDFGLMLGMKF